MPAEILLVKVGMTMTDGMVEEWYVPDGGTVEKGQLLYRLETEKVNLDVDADAHGVVKHAVGVGVTLKPGDVIGWIYAPGEAIPDHPGAPATMPQPGRSGATGLTVAPLSSAPRRRDGARAPASPAARRLAGELGIDYATIAGSGPGGRIVEADVRAAAAAAAVSVAVAGAAPEAVAIANTRTGSIPLKGKRRTIATRMQQSLQQSAQLTMDMDVVMDEAVLLRGQLITEWEREAIRPTFTDIVVRAAAKALRVHPLMNSVYGESEIALLREVHIGIAVAVDDGLVVPVLRDASERSLKEITVASAALTQAAREGRLALDDMAGGTFTVSALGMYGVDSFTPILHAPQTGILGVNRIREEVAWRDGRPVPQQRMRLSLTWDHRVLDGVPAAQFLGTVRDLLQAPYRLLV